MAEVRDGALLKGRATVIHEAHLNVGDEVMKRSGRVGEERANEVEERCDGADGDRGEGNANRENN